MKSVRSHPSVGGASPPAESEARTRDRVAALLLERGPQTAALLGERLGLSPAGVRRHLDALVEEGAVTSREARSRGVRGRGRPARVFMITESGRASFPHAYDDLAVNALRFLRQAGGEAAVEAFAVARVADLEERLRSAADAAPATRRIAAVADALSADGYAASTEPGPAGAQLCQHHCPVAYVASEFPQLCEAETAALGRALGSHVQRLATIAHGDGVCTTHIPAPPARPRASLAGAGPVTAGATTGKAR